eukprot:3076601-Rhodomonas_salina.1
MRVVPVAFASLSRDAAGRARLQRNLDLTLGCRGNAPAEEAGELVRVREGVRDGDEQRAGHRA